MIIGEKMNKEQLWKKLEDRAFELVKKAGAYRRLVDRTNSNCRSTQSHKHYRLEHLNSLGVHLSNPVFQKLMGARKGLVYSHESNYIDDALTRIGNRTMTQEEYTLLKEIPKEKLIGYTLDERLEDLQKRLANGKRISARGCLTWLDGPFGCGRIPRDKRDFFHEGIKK